MNETDLPIWQSAPRLVDDPDINAGIECSHPFIVDACDPTRFISRIIHHQLCIHAVPDLMAQKRPHGGTDVQLVSRPVRSGAMDHLLDFTQREYHTIRLARADQGDHILARHEQHRPAMLQALLDMAVRSPPGHMMLTQEARAGRQATQARCRMVGDDRLQARVRQGHPLGIAGGSRGAQQPHDLVAWDRAVQYCEINRRHRPRRH